jgi:hypothetical protein
MVHHLYRPTVTIWFLAANTLVQRSSKGKDINGEREGLRRINKLRWGEGQCSKAKAVGGRLIGMYQEARSEIAQSHVQISSELYVQLGPKYVYLPKGSQALYLRVIHLSHGPTLRLLYFRLPIGTRVLGQLKQDSNVEIYP